jgi:trehalose-6-phosphate synthase
MDPAERIARMQRMYGQVEANNIYRWAGNFLTALSRTQPSSVVVSSGA